MNRPETCGMKAEEERRPIISLVDILIYVVSTALISYLLGVANREINLIVVVFSASINLVYFDCFNKSELQISLLELFERAWHDNSR